jgi:C_GCAxxG_C_C family probable redox protein
LHVVQEARGFPCITELAAGFGGGIGGEQDVCGAVTGGVIAIGYQQGQAGGNQEEIAKRAKPSVVALYRGFQEKFGAVDCRTLIGYDYRDPAQFEKGHADPERKAKCNAFKEHAVRALLAEE